MHFLSCSTNIYIYIYMVFDNECCKNTSYEYLIRRYIAQLLDCTHKLIFIIVVCAVINICIKFGLKRKNIVNECSNTQLKIIHIQLWDVIHSFLNEKYNCQ